LLVSSVSRGGPNKSGHDVALVEQALAVPRPDRYPGNRSNCGMPSGMQWKGCLSTV
jgi:hypothetical protein